MGKQRITSKQTLIWKIEVETPCYNSFNTIFKPNKAVVFFFKLEFKFLREIKPDLESLSFSKSQIEKPVQKVETSSPRM